MKTLYNLYKVLSDAISYFQVKKKHSLTKARNSTSSISLSPSHPTKCFSSIMIWMRSCNHFFPYYWGTDNIKYCFECSSTKCREKKQPVFFSIITKPIPHKNSEDWVKARRSPWVVGILEEPVLIFQNDWETRQSKR